MTGLLLIRDFAVMLVLAGLMGWAARRIGLSVVVGYLVTGFIVGPHTPPFAFVADLDRVQTLSQLGLVFLMFFVGMRLSLKRIRALGVGLLLATALSAWLIFTLTQLLTGALGWGQQAGLFLGAMLMVSSSAIIAKILEETGSLNDRFAQKAQGVTVLEDVVAIVMLALLTPQTAAGGEGLGRTLGLLMAFAVLLVVAGLLFLPKVLARYARSGDRDIKTVLVCGIICAAAVLASAAGFSVALGAFLIGVVLGETSFRVRIEKALTGTQDLFSAIFFVSIGMLIDPLIMLREWQLILGLSFFAIMVRTLGPSLALWLTGARLRTAFMAGLVLTPVGEFSYIIAQLGVASGAVPERFYALAVGISLVTAIAAPLLTRKAEGLADGLFRVLPGSVLRVADAYQNWLATLQKALSRRPWWKLTRGRLVQVTVEILLIAALLAFSVPAAESVDRFLSRIEIALPGWEWIYGGMIMLVVTALVVAAWRNLAALSMIYAEAFSGFEQQSDRIRPIVEGVLQLVGASFLFWTIWLFWPSAPGATLILVVMLIIAIVMAAVLWRRLIRWHSHVMNSLSLVLKKTDQRRLMAGSSLREGEDAWRVEIQSCTVPEMAQCRGKTLADLNLRAQFGCTVAEIERQGTIVASPAPGTVVFAGDRLLLFGTEDQIRAARAFLETESKEVVEPDLSDVRLEAVVVPGDSPHVRRSLAQLGIYQKTGVQVVGVRRDNQRRLGPSGQETLEADDELLVLGEPDSLEQFKKWLIGEQEQVIEN